MRNIFSYAEGLYVTRQHLRTSDFTLGASQTADVVSRFSIEQELCKLKGLNFNRDNQFRFTWWVSQIFFVCWFYFENVSLYMVLAIPELVINPHLPRKCWDNGCILPYSATKHVFAIKFQVIPKFLKLSWSKRQVSQYREEMKQEPLHSKEQQMSIK